MTIVPVVIFLLVVGVVLYLLRSRIDPTLRTIIIVLLVLTIALWLLDAFSIYPLPAAFRIGAR